MTTYPPVNKYRPAHRVELPNRQWPDRTHEQAPIWCDVSLRDGNQSLCNPMTIEQKLEMFMVLVKIGFKEIEVGFPSASDTEFRFVRTLIERNLIPDDVTIQVLTPAREELIKRTAESLIGARNVIIHLYNSTSPVQRKCVFGQDKAGIVNIAVTGTRWVKQYAAQFLSDSSVRFEYSPESFTATEPEFAVEICLVVMMEWQASDKRQVILNLPATVETDTPNAYADLIEWFCSRLTPEERAAVIISVHTHNDRGTAVAATELALLAGADRVEGTLFGNGERTGNVDLITLGLNLYTKGIDPRLDLSDLVSIREVYERSTGMTVGPRHPYAGDLVFTAFSGSHQDAIRKSWAAQKPEKSWEVLYIPIDPVDIGRSYSHIIRLNSQSGKGGVAYVLEHDHGINLPKAMQIEFGPIATRCIDTLGREVSSHEVEAMFRCEYIARPLPYSLKGFSIAMVKETVYCSTTVTDGLVGDPVTVDGTGNGPVDAFVSALRTGRIADVQVLQYSEHSLGKGSEAQAIAYVHLSFPDGRCLWGAGIDVDIGTATARAVLSAMNRHAGS